MPIKNIHTGEVCIAKKWLTIYINKAFEKGGVLTLNQVPRFLNMK